ncbi:CheY-like chemotaxis protein [Sphaerotilus hippei]|uniref:CheY-like chemotaxis protein n=1 Tax=Sphaerotilus hippei TaxID=744406 RepID=A0A318GWR5_9BURK|nr:response regulator [Sphaerotilus hippei]PXW94010.1 CheY-like chemotaxis protein [Sphaerotilus hippei]
MTTRRHALVVDDNQLNSRLAALFLERLGWTTVALDSGEAALQALRDGGFDLVLLDLRMPRIGGEQVCQTIRQELGLTRLPVVAYTAHSMPEERARILASGFDGLLIKPISFKDVKDLCDALPLPS